MIRITTNVLTCILLFSISVPALSYRVNPMIAEMSSIGRDAQLSLKVTNTEAAPLTVELVPTLIELSNTGKETRLPADDDLLVIPPTAIVQPGKSQNFNVRYIGDPELDKSKTYRVSINQVSVTQIEEGKGGLSFPMNFNTLYSVVPAESVAEPIVKSIKQDGDKWKLYIENSGNKYIRLSTTTWTVTDQAGQSKELDGQTVKAALNGNLVLPGDSRVFMMQPIDGISSDGLTIDINTGE